VFDNHAFPTRIFFLKCYKFTFTFDLHIHFKLHILTITLTNLVIESLRFEEAELLGTFYEREAVLLVCGECLGRGVGRQVE